jgi:hypothetical protein
MEGDTGDGFDDASSYSYMSEDGGHLSSTPSLSAGGGSSGGGLPYSSSAAPAAAAASSTSDYVKPHFRCMTAATLQPTMQGIVRTVSQMTQLPLGDAELALHHYAWRAERLMDDWATDSSLVRSSAGLSSGPDPAPLPSPLPGPSAMCEVTLSSYPWSEMDSLPCGHFFSKEAWGESLAAAMADPIKAQLSRCLAAPACKELVRPRMWAAYAAANLQRFKAFGVRRYTQSSRHIVWCPGADCQYAILHTENTK